MFNIETGEEVVALGQILRGNQPRAKGTAIRISESLFFGAPITKRESRAMITHCWPLNPCRESKGTPPSFKRVLTYFGPS
jgi:hypothetical protein